MRFSQAVGNYLKIMTFPSANETNDPPSPPVASSDLINFRRRHRSAMSPAALSPSELPWHGIESRTSEDVQAKLRSRHKSSIDDRRLTIDIDDPIRDSSGKHFSPSLKYFHL